jgi:hypothetical protein
MDTRARAQSRKMKRKTLIALFSIAAVLVIAAAVYAATALSRDTTFELRVRDAVSGRWVWDMEIKLQNREIRGFYQSDAGTIPLRFTRLRPGKATVEISAPSYQPASFPVSLARGANKLEKPIDMVGLEIPDLAKFFIFEKLDGVDIVSQVRPVGGNGQAVLNHPCMDLWIGCRVYVQVKNGIPVEEEVEEGSARGEELFRGEIPWEWDPAPESVFRYSARIPGVKLKQMPSNFRVIDYLIVIPNPLKITRKEIDELMTRVYALDARPAIASALDAEKDRLSYYFDTSWNVKARQE